MAQTKMISQATQSDQFASALQEHAQRFQISLDRQSIARLRDYYEQVSSWNARLHLVAPCSPAEFATRHVLESLLALAYLPLGARIIDIGSGAGLPIIPCLLVRTDLNATLIESSGKKAIFLREALRSVQPHGRAKIICERFEQMAPPESDALTCRALDRFTSILPKLFEWSANVQILLLFGGEALREQIALLTPTFEAVNVPASERRYLFIVNRAGSAQLPKKAG